MNPSFTCSIKSLGPKIWELIIEMKEVESLREYKNWKCLSCPCRLCKQCIIGLSFFDKVFSFGSSIIFSNVNIIIFCFLFNILFDIKVLFLRLHKLAFFYIQKGNFYNILMLYIYFFTNVKLMNKNNRLINII